MKKAVIGILFFILAFYAGVAIRQSGPPLRVGTEIWNPQMAKASQEFGVSTRLIEAVIACESGANPKAVSPRGAIGLMQLLPDTARALANKIGLKNFRDSDLYDPETNVRLGTAYLAQLGKSFYGDPALVVAAYNAGPSRARQWAWLENGSDSLSAVKNRAYPETTAYVLNVLTRAKIIGE